MMTLSVETHFDAAFQPAIVQPLLQQLARVSPADRLDWLNAESERAMMAYGVSETPLARYRALKRMSACVMLHVGIDSQSRPFRELRRDQQFLNRLALSGLAPNETMTNMNARLYLHAGRYAADNFRTFVVDPALGELLMHTELIGLTGADLTLPYRSLYIVAPRETGLRVWNNEDGWHWLAGVYLLLEDGDDAYDKEHIDEPCRTLRLMAVGNWTMEPLPSLPSETLPDDALLYWQIPLADSWSLDDCILYYKRNARDHFGRLPSVITEMGDEWDRIFHWVVNVLMYATSASCRADVHGFDREAEALRRRMHKAKNPKRRRHYADELKRADQRRYTVLGGNMLSLSSQKGGGQPLTKRVLVSGHWRMQACGPRWSERRRTLIEPFWRGPEDAPESELPHRLK